MSLKLLFLGSPGVGKGTYAQVLTEVLSIPQISTGDLLREEAKKDSDLGRQISDIMKRGDLVSDDIMISLIKERIKADDCENGFILDGFPRTIPQAEALQEIIPIDHVFNFKANDEVIIERLSGRITCKQCGTIFHKSGNPPKEDGICDKCGGELYQRADDTPEAVQNRLVVYQEKTAPLIDFYKNKELLVEIIINKPISEIKDNVISKVQNFLSGKISFIGEIL